MYLTLLKSKKTRKRKRKTTEMNVTQGKGLKEDGVGQTNLGGKQATLAT